jgi:hypothetical protein
MIKFDCRSRLQPMLLATALLLAEGVAPSLAGSVTVTGANGGTPGGAAPAATADEGHLIPNSDPSNTAEATSGNGGAGGNAVLRCFVFQGCRLTPAGAGGPGGAATSTATTSISSATAATAMATSFGGAGGAGGSNMTRYYSPAAGGVGGTADSSATVSNTKGSASATATSTGGKGGVGGSPVGSGGTGGGASASSSATGGGAGTVSSQATATGGAGGGDGPSTTAIDPWAYGGSAQANATGVAVTGNVQANASAYGGWSLLPGTAAFAQSEAKNSKGEEALTTASAPADAGGISPSAVTSAGVGSGSIIPIAPHSSQVVSDAILSLTGPTNHETIGEGAMSAAFSGGLLQQTYAGTAVFDFATTSAPMQTLDLDMLPNDAVGIGFNSLTLQVINLVDNATLLSETFSSLTEAAPFFQNGNSVTLGTVTGESQSIEIEFSLSYWDSTGITPNASFGFAYALVDPPVGAVVPEPSTWAMLIISFVGLGVASRRRSRGSNSPPRLAR